MKVHTVHSNLHFLNENFGASHISPSLSQPTVHMVRGWEESVAYKTGFINLQLRKFEVQYFYPKKWWCTLNTVNSMAHCPWNELNFRIKTYCHSSLEHLQWYSTVYAWYLGQIHVNKSWTYCTLVQCTVCRCNCAPAVTGSVFMRRFRLFLGQCKVWDYP